MMADDNERVRQVAERLQESSDRATAFFEAHDDETILGGLRYVFERGKELEAAGLTTKEVANAIGSEIDLSVVGSALLEGQSWGYSLNQRTIAAALDSE